MLLMLFRFSLCLLKKRYKITLLKAVFVVVNTSKQGHVVDANMACMLYGFHQSPKLCMQYFAGTHGTLKFPFGLELSMEY